MQNSLRTLSGLALTALFAGLFTAPVALAAIECDQDGDGYIVIPNQVMSAVAPDVPYDENGNFNALQWGDFYDVYVGADKIDNETCAGLNFKSGAEPRRCDNTVIGANSNVYDSSVVTSPVRGASVNPGAFDQPGNSIDEDCDGQDASLLAAGGAEQDLGGLADRVINLLSRLVIFVSAAILIWGAVLYSTAAGDEQKTSKARKAIIGAVIGLIVGLLAPTVVNLIASSLV